MPSPHPRSGGDSFGGGRVSAQSANAAGQSRRREGSRKPLPSQLCAQAHFDCPLPLPGWHGALRRPGLSHGPNWEHDKASLQDSGLGPEGRLLGARLGQGGKVPGTASQKQGLALGVRTGEASKLGPRTSSPSGTSSARGNFWGPLGKQGPPPPALPLGSVSALPGGCLARTRPGTHIRPSAICPRPGEGGTAPRRLREAPTSRPSMKPRGGGWGALEHPYTPAHQPGHQLGWLRDPGTTKGPGPPSHPASLTPRPSRHQAGLHGVGMGGSRRTAPSQACPPLVRTHPAQREVEVQMRCGGRGEGTGWARGGEGGGRGQGSWGCL